MSNVNLKQPRPPINLRPLAGALILIGAVAAATAASINPTELDALRQEARRTGAVPVLVHLQSASLEQIRCCEAALRKSADVKIQQLLIELGRAALTNGQWGTGVGQLGLYVTKPGLDVLLKSSNAISFMPGMSWKSRTALAGNDGSHDAIDLALRIQGFVDLEVVANVDGLELDFRPDASVALNGPASAMRAGLSRLSVLLQSANDTEVTDRTAALGNIAARLAGSPSSTSPMVTMRVTREGLLKLADSDDLRGHAANRVC